MAWMRDSVSVGAEHQRDKGETSFSTEAPSTDAPSQHTQRPSRVLRTQLALQRQKGFLVPADQQDLEASFGELDGEFASDARGAPSDDGPGTLLGAVV